MRSQFKTLILFSFVILSNIITIPQTLAQEKAVPVNIEVIEGQYLKGLCKVIPNEKQRTKVEFNAQKVSVLMNIDQKVVLLEFLNTDCKAYCPRAKRVRQLHKGDEKLLRNVLKENQSAIIEQLKAKGLM